MNTIVRRLGVSAAVLGGLLAGVTSADAQYYQPPQNFQSYFNPFQAQQQFAYNLAAQRAAYAQRATAYNNPVFAAGNQYAPGLPTFQGGGNQYTPGSGYDSNNNPYTPYYGDSGSYLRGAADYMRAYGESVNSIEQARITREQALQARYDTKKKAFDTEMYIKANTPTYTEEQAKIAKMTLRRIQSNATGTEISNGKALNLLLDDLRKYPGKKAAMETLTLAEDTLKQINVTKSSGNFGLLREKGKFSWPIALQEILAPAQQKEIEGLTEALYTSAVKGKPDINALKDLRTGLEQIRDNLSRKVNEIPTTDYLEAKRFLNDFDDARFALERGEAATQLKYREFIAGGKTVQEVVDYLVGNGYKLAPAISGDEAAYRAMHSAMVALDVAVNTQYTTPEYKDGPVPPP